MKQFKSLQAKLGTRSKILENILEQMALTHHTRLFHCLIIQAGSRTPGLEVTVNRIMMAILGFNSCYSV
jgi:hypothetical protein